MKIFGCWTYLVCVFKISFKYVLILYMLLNKNCLFCLGEGIKRSRRTGAERTRPQAAGSEGTGEED